MSTNSMTFGQFLRDRRMRSPRKLTIRDMAAGLDVSIGYFCDLENDRRIPSESLDINKICELLRLDANDRAAMFDLAAKKNGCVPADIKYILFNSESGNCAREALRMTNEGFADEDDWMQFLEKLRKRKQRLKG